MCGTGGAMWGGCQGSSRGRQPSLGQRRREEGPVRRAQERSDGGVGVDTRHWIVLRIQPPPSIKHGRVRVDVGPWRRWREGALGAAHVGILWITAAFARAKTWKLRAERVGVVLAHSQDGALVAPVVTHHPRPLEEEGGGSQSRDRALAPTCAQTAAVLQAEHMSAQPRVLVAQRQQLTFPHQVAEPPLLPGPLGGLVVLEPLIPVLGVLLVVGGHLPLAARDAAQAAAGAQTEETLSHEWVARHRVGDRGDPWIRFDEALSWEGGGGGHVQSSRLGATRPPRC